MRLLGETVVKVLVFDIDGTLIKTNQSDEQHLQAAITEILPGARLESFRDFAEQTDPAILGEMCAQGSRQDSVAVERAVQNRFLALLQASIDADPGFFAPVPGAREVFGVVEEAGWTPAVATGGWRPSAELRLSAAGIPIADRPLATASEAVRRVDIIQLAVDQAGSGTEPSEVVFIGDGIWDIRACRELSIGFVGRSSPDSDQRLAMHGAKAAISDFKEPECLLAYLSDPGALVPTGWAA